MKGLICHNVWENRWSVRLLFLLFVCFNLDHVIETQCTNVSCCKSQFLAQRNLRLTRDFYIYTVIYKLFWNFIRTSILSTVDYNTISTNILTWERWGNKYCLNILKKCDRKCAASLLRKIMRNLVDIQIYKNIYWKKYLAQ